MSNEHGLRNTTFRFNPVNDTTEILQLEQSPNSANMLIGVFHMAFKECIPPGESRIFTVQFSNAGRYANLTKVLDCFREALMKCATEHLSHASAEHSWHDDMEKEDVHFSVNIQPLEHNLQ
ncbi:hypothetical protein AUJ46_04270 [Candidatus Peregrinibacteria bacterium CG1_02_54_53]|nr:MAG: hypothetical protein AUJ46_04270 [Candidatus Peregrinibacteria bacterium CG1_02_54_53]